MFMPTPAVNHQLHSVLQHRVSVLSNVVKVPSKKELHRVPKK